METIITRDTDIIREYLAALDARERGLSPFARLAAIVKLAQLRKELHATELETTDEDLHDLRQEIDERLKRTFLRRLASGKWGARLLMFVMQVGFQQLVLAICWLATLLFVKFVPRPGWWNPLLPHEEPISLYLFVFLFFFVTPALAVAALFAGRFFRSWKKTLPITLLILAAAIGGAFLVVRRLDKNLIEKNPVQKSSSLSQFAKEQGVTVQNYREWVKENWLLSDARFQSDYENYLRNGPGRWVTAKLGANDTAWRDGLPVLSEYIGSGQDPRGFREWLQYYLERNRIISEENAEAAAQIIAGDANQQYLSIWQVEPFLKERDERSYRAYLGSVNVALKKWGLLSLGIYALLFLLYYLIGPALTLAEQLTGRSRRVKHIQEAEFISDENDIRNTPSKSAAEKFKERYYAFPERREVLSTPYYDTPFALMANAHRSFVTLAVFTTLVVFAFWAAVYGYDLLTENPNAPSQTALMRSYLLFGGQADDRPESQAQLSTVNAAQFVPDNTVSTYGVSAGARSKNAKGNELLADNLSDLGQQFDETNYQTNKRFKEQMQTIAAQASEISVLRSLSSQLQQTTSQFPTQVADVGTRANAAEARAGQVIGEINDTRQKTDNLEKIFATKLGEVDNRASRAADLVGKIEDQASVLATRTEALEKELDRRARQIEARTEELGERTASLRDLEDRISRLQRVTFSAMVLNLKGEVDGLDYRLDSGFYRTLTRGSAQRDVNALRDRINAFTKELRDINTDQSKQFADQLDALAKRLEQVATKAK
jgi:energy-coupling factor transporter transmembrane protein EcfT